MRLKRLIVRGFKSFADRTEFDFDADLTGIVGPNGCGKSNVVDALKWVLGDQRAKSLRGSEMTDVIFKGAEGRDGLHQAEVTVELEDGDPEGPDGVRTMSIGRRLTRDKESTYLLDGQSVRLRDVRSALMDTGLGVHAYAVMEQGRIDAVLSANPEDRRAIFEEAAGISRFKIQKKETLRKLERTEQNLARVGDLLQERERRIRSLKAQAGRARRHAELSDELRQWQVAVAVHDAHTLRDKILAVQARLDDTAQQLAAIHEERTGVGKELDELEARISASASDIAQLAETLSEIQSRRDAARHRAERADQRRDDLHARVLEADERARVVAEQAEEREGSLIEAREKIVACEERSIALGKQLDALRETTRAAQRRVQELKTERERAREAVLEHMHERTRRRNLAHDQSARAQGHTARLARLAERDAELERVIARATGQLDASARELAVTEQRAAVRKLREQRLIEVTESVDQDAGELARADASLRERCAALTSRLDTLRGMEAQHEGVDSGPRRLLESKPEGLRGRLVDSIDVDLEHSRALEAALGPYVQALIVDTRAQAESMLRQLVDEGGGRAMLLVREEFDPSFVECCCKQKLPEGAVLLASKLRLDPETRAIVYWILRGVALVDDLDPITRPDAEGRSVQRTHPDLCFVTRDGLVSCGPRVEGGHSESTSGLIVRKAQIQQLDEDLAKLVAEREELAGRLDSVNERVDRLRLRTRVVADALQADRERHQRAAQDRERIVARREQSDRERQTLRLEAHDTRRQHAGAIAELGRHLLDELLLRRREDTAAEHERSLAASAEAAREEADRAVAREHDLRVEQTACAADRDAAQQAARLHEQAVADLHRAGEEAEQRATAAASEAESCVAEAAQARVVDARESDAFEAATSERDAAQEQAEQVRRQREERAARAKELDAQRDTLQEAQGESRLEHSRLEDATAQLHREVRRAVGVRLDWWLGQQDDLGIVVRAPFGPPAPAGCVVEVQGPHLPPRVVDTAYTMPRRWLDEDFEVEAARKSERAVRGQLERLGSVNVDAVAELEEEEAGLGSLQSDHQDLQQSRKQLYEALKTMERESRDLFERTFEQARANFQAIFRKLFQGGRADMYLTEDEGGDALEAGIDIVAKPPGKELQSIALLSGGERSLTALAILFAVFKVKPSPFCILDEVDAALDETNVERFLRVLGDFVGPTQFCVVTHHKRTMAECQSLYGITMQKRGVSTRIAVDLREVDDLSGPPGGPDPAEKVRIAGEEAVGF